MKLLKDDELFPRVDPSNPGRIVLDFPPRVDWYNADSPIQPSSIDLHIGNIYLPGENRNDPGGESNPLLGHRLKRGETAVVETQEQLRLPANIAGFGFPPSHVSSQGILMTNPGHIDPGYSGPMYFTVINMGKKSYVLNQGQVIVTVLLVELFGDVLKDWRSRQVRPPRPIQELLDLLSADFMDIDTRAAHIAKETSEKAVKDAELTIKSWQVHVPLLVAVVGGLFTLWSNWLNPAWEKPLQEVKRDVAVLNRSLEAQDIKKRVEELERLVKDTKQAQRSGGASQGSRPQHILPKAPGIGSGHEQ